ncbi:MAG: hypothetical protein WDW38_004998 [Sanguina aurantia]
MHAVFLEPAGALAVSKSSPPDFRASVTEQASSRGIFGVVQDAPGSPILDRTQTQTQAQPSEGLAADHSQQGQRFPNASDQWGSSSGDTDQLPAQQLPGTAGATSNLQTMAPVQTIHTTIYSITPQQIPADFVQNLTLNLSSGPAPHRYMVTSAAARQLDGNVEIVVHLMPVLEEAGGPGNPVQALDQSATIMANAPSQL